MALSETAQRVGMSLRVVGASFCHSFSSTHVLRRVLTAVQFGDVRPGMGICRSLAANVRRCGLMIGSCSRRALAGLGSPVRSRKEKSCCSMLIRRTPAPRRCEIQTPALETVLRRACLDVHLQLTVCFFCLIFLLEWMPVTLCRC